MKSEYVDITQDQEMTFENTIETDSPGVKRSEICFGVIMAIVALTGMWGVVSLLIKVFLTS